MKTSLIAATTIVSATLFSGAVSAQESVIQSLLSNMVSHAVSATANEVKANVYQAVATTSYHFELDRSADTAVGKVSVTDLATSRNATNIDQEKDLD